MGACPLCHSLDFMERDAFSTRFHNIARCQNPPCMFRRAQKASNGLVKRYPAYLEIPESVDEPTPEKADELAAIRAVLKSIPGKTSRIILSVLVDQKPHSTAEFIDAGVSSVIALRTAINRLGERGFQIRRNLGSSQTPYTYQLTSLHLTRKAR
jgi:hypothetical protein